MSIDLGGGRSIFSITLVDLDTEEKATLFERKGSKCHFYEDIFLKDYIISLRIDRGDIRNTDPVLDADIYENISGKKGRRLKNGPWHHTTKQFDDKEDQKIYDFSFNDLRLRLGARMTFLKTFRVDGVIVENKDDSSQT